MTFSATKSTAPKTRASARVAVDDTGELKQRADSYNLLLYTNPAKVDWTCFVNLLKRRGTLAMMGFPRSVEFDPQELVVLELSMTGSFLCSPRLYREMLPFAEAKHIRARVELMPMSQANDAIQKIRENRARYRLVLTRG